MATSEFRERGSTSLASHPESAGEAAANFTRIARGTSKLWMVLDGITVFGAAAFATLYAFHLGPVAAAERIWLGTLMHGRSMSMLLALVCGFTFVLIMISRRLRLYTPTRPASLLHEQKLSVQACFTAGLFLTCTLYLVHAEEVPRSIVLVTIGLVTIALSVRRLVYRALIYRRFDRGMGTRNVLIVGTGPEAHALRHHLESFRRLGYTFKGFIDFPGSGSDFSVNSSDVVGTLDSLFLNVRKHFVDEVFFTTSCESGIVRDVVDRARKHGVDLRVIPDMYDGLTWSSPIEYIGQFATIPLPCGRAPQAGLLFKRIADLVLSCMILIAISPLLLMIAIAIKLDSRGPVFYSSERIGKKGRVFSCTKFRTMVFDAERRRASMMHMNEREGVLFKISNDPRVTRVGHFLRKYSMDELPQFYNVLRGDMSIVGPRPPLASEVKEYKLSNLRRLDVTPGITGLWQVQARQDPSFDSYISLDVAYIENWNIWLDFKIIMRTIGVMLSGTGS